MTIAKFFREVIFVLEWFVNSEHVFAVLAVVVLCMIVCFALGALWRFLRDKYIFERGARDE